MESSCFAPGRRRSWCSASTASRSAKWRGSNWKASTELIALRDRTPPHERYFYWTMDASGGHFEKRRLPRCNTYGEALALRQFLEEGKARKVLVVSSGIHLRRVSLTFDKVFRNVPIEFRYCPAPSRLDGVDKYGWWRRPEDRRYILQETAKLAGYRLILSMPGWAIRLLMPLKD